MLPIILVLFVASSALAAPSVSVSQYNVNEIPPVADNGKPSSSIQNALDILRDGGDTNIYILTIEQILNDLANQPDPNSQALAVGQALGIIGELIYGNPGDCCTAAELINAFVAGNRAAIRVALVNYVQTLASNIDAIVQVVQNPNSIRYSTGRRGNCVGGGRNYQFDAAWDAIQSSCNPFQTNLLFEESCASKRLYNAFNSRSNNVGAAVTASSLPPVTEIVQKAYSSINNFLNAVVRNGNLVAAAATAKAELARAIPSVV